MPGLDGVFTIDQMQAYLEQVIPPRKLEFMQPFRKLNATANPSKAQKKAQEEFEQSQLSSIKRTRAHSPQILQNLIDENCADLALEMKRGAGLFNGDLLGCSYAKTCERFVACEKSQKKLAHYQFIYNSCLARLGFETKVMFMRDEEVARCADVCDGLFQKEQS